MNQSMTNFPPDDKNFNTLLSPEHTTSFILIFPWFQLSAKAYHERILTVYIMADIETSS